MHEETLIQCFKSCSGASACINKCNEDFGENMKNCPCMDNCKNGCPCDHPAADRWCDNNNNNGDDEEKFVLILNTYRPDNTPVLIDLEGKID